MTRIIALFILGLSLTGCNKDCLPAKFKPGQIVQNKLTGEKLSIRQEFEFSHGTKLCDIEVRDSRGITYYLGRDEVEPIND